MLEPLEVFLGLRLDAPEVDRPADGEELRGQVHVVFFHDAVPSGADIVVVNLDAILLQRQHVGAVVILVDPAVPEFRVRFLVLVAIRRTVLDDGSDCGVDDGVVLPEGVFEVALQQQMIVRLVDNRHEHRMTIADVPTLVRLHRQEHRR